jgi:curved DNA-binding protein CbpA
MNPFFSILIDMAAKTYYNILGVERDSSSEEIKSAYRKMALKFHPDLNPDSAEAENIFKLISSSWAVLSDTEKRKEYDSFLDKSHINKEDSSKQDQEDESLDLVESLYEQLNVFLWDIEDFLQKLNPLLFDEIYGTRPLWLYIEKMLRFIDKWALGPQNFDDYFIRITSKTKTRFLNYFYDIRRRIDREFPLLKSSDLNRILPASTITHMDAVIEVLSHTLYYLNNLINLILGEIDVIEDYSFENVLYIDK